MSIPDLLSAIGALERMAFHRDPEALQALISLLPRLYRGNLTDLGKQPAPALTRLAAAALAVLIDPTRQFPLAKYRDLAVDRRTLAGVFHASAYGAVGAARAAGGIWREGRVVAAREDLLTLMKVVCLETLDCILPYLPGIEPKLRLPLVIGCLAETVVISHREDAMRNWLIDHPELIESAEMNEPMAARLAGAWMFCSYADHPRRHEVKKALNAVIRRYVARTLGRVPQCRPSARVVGTTLRPDTTPANRADLPVVCVVAERFRSGHAMHRCYAPSIAQLRGRYRVVLLVARTQVDDEAAAVADEVVLVPEAPSRINELVALVEAQAPDMMFFPSVGMSFWAVALANLRLAPVQLMSIGHPASAFSDCIDYMVIGRDVLGQDPGVYHERVVVREAAGNPILPHHRYRPESTPPRERPELLRVAVPAKSMKLSPRFLTLCRRLREQAGRALEFHFFPNVEGIYLAHLAARMQLILPGSIVHARTGYPQYMKLLGACDVALATFPFGNANSTVDSLLLGRPVVAMQGDEPSAMTDTRMMRLGRAPEWLLATDEASYEAAALRLIRDDALRLEASRAILAGDPYHALYETELASHPTDFADTLDWICSNHERLQASQRRVWLPEDRGSCA